jgi:hypothetical protein
LEAQKSVNEGNTKQRPKNKTKQNADLKLYYTSIAVKNSMVLPQNQT